MRFFFFEDFQKEIYPFDLPFPFMNSLFNEFVPILSIKSLKME